MWRETEGFGSQTGGAPTSNLAQPVRQPPLSVPTCTNVILPAPHGPLHGTVFGMTNIWSVIIGQSLLPECSRSLLLKPGGEQSQPPSLQYAASHQPRLSFGEDALCRLFGGLITPLRRTRVLCSSAARSTHWPQTDAPRLGLAVCGLVVSQEFPREYLRQLSRERHYPSVRRHHVPLSCTTARTTGVKGRGEEGEDG